MSKKEVSTGSVQTQLSPPNIFNPYLVRSTDAEPQALSCFSVPVCMIVPILRGLM